MTLACYSFVYTCKCLPIRKNTYFCTVKLFGRDIVYLELFSVALILENYTVLITTLLFHVILPKMNVNLLLLTLTLSAIVRHTNGRQMDATTALKQMQ